MNNINLNMLNMINQMNINMMQMMKNMKNMNNNNNFVDKKNIVNIIFDCINHRKINIQISNESTIAEVINKYIESEFEGENKIKLRFIINGSRIDADEYKNIKIKELLENGSVITVFT